MADKVDIAALAKLARLEVSEAEMAKLEKEIPDILHFVETIQAASAVGRTKSASGETKSAQGSVEPKKALHNVMREDENPIESGKFTKVLLEAAPAREGDRIAVKQVISRQNVERRK
jgi:aspartyl/glutamyl-tRNA(Asn/Gln) amidotransferase C subunit